MFRFALFPLVAAAGLAAADDKKPTPADLAAAVVEKGDKAKAVKQTLKGGDADPPEHWVFHYRRDVGMRVEKCDPKTAAVLVNVHDFKTEKMLTLDPATKTATVGTRRAPPPGLTIPRSRGPATVTAGTDDKVGGRVLRVFEGVENQLPGGTWVLWVDPKTDLPARLRVNKPGPADKVATLEVEFSDWDKEFDAKLFSTDVPAGYKVVEAKK
jgi:outer membrane lipoprotein-sorting protein